MSENISDTKPEEKPNPSMDEKTAGEKDSAEKVGESSKNEKSADNPDSQSIKKDQTEKMETDEVKDEKVDIKEEKPSGSTEAGGTDIFGKCLEKYQEKKEERRASVDQSCGTDEENSNDGNEKPKKFATQIGDLSALDEPDLRNGEEDEEDSKSKLEGFSDFGGENIQGEQNGKDNIKKEVKTISFKKKEEKTQVEMKNKSTMKKPKLVNKGITCRPSRVTKGTQTESASQPVIVPVMVPIYLPVPMQMYQRPLPVPVPMPLPIPVPIFIPTTRNTTRGIKKFMRKMKSKMPENVFEAQLLEMAGAAGGEKNDAFDSDDSEYDANFIDDEEDGEGNYQPQRPKIPAEDIETVIKAGNIVPKPLPQVTPDANPQPAGYPGYRMQGQRPVSPKGIGHQFAGIKRRNSGDADPYEMAKRMAPNSNFRSRGGQRRRQNRPVVAVETNPALAALSFPPKERPDAKHHLKFTYGVNAWRHWVVGKNAELEKARAQGKYMKPFETDILKLRADELNYTLCMFVKEVRKPNGEPYASDSILYLTLGIQEYLFENGRIDNIFTDMYYEPFTSALHEVIKDFKLPVNELGYFVTRIEEEHLWESKQLGAHSPQVLLNTLIYFNAKFFMMKTMEDHTKLSFTHIMKHWKKGGTATPANKNPPAPGEKRTTLLRYYPPAHLKNSRHDDRKCFEQQELPDNPLRCPVKLYEFYLSHCPESAKSKTDSFYLQPERSCVPDSPVWYSTNNLNPHQLEKMLARILMVREVQEHMLADAASSS